MFRTRLHVYFLFSAVAIAVLLGIHMAIQHLNNVLATGEADPTAWAPMIARAASSSWIVIYILLLGFGLYHGLYGLRGIIIEVTKTESKIKAINTIFIIVGIVVFIWGSYVAIALSAS